MTPRQGKPQDLGVALNRGHIFVSHNMGDDYVNGRVAPCNDITSEGQHCFSISHLLFAHAVSENVCAWLLANIFLQVVGDLVISLRATDPDTGLYSCPAIGTNFSLPQTRSHYARSGRPPAPASLRPPALSVIVIVVLALFTNAFPPHLCERRSL